MDTAHALDQLASHFRQHGLSVAVVARLSDGERSEADLVIWPYAVREDPAARQQALPAREADGRRASPVRRQHTHLMVLPRDVGGFDRARRLVLEQGLLPGGEVPTRHQVESPPLADLAALVRAGGAPLRLALAVVVG